MVKLSGIYMLYSTDKRIKKFYVGSTVDLVARLCRHKYECNTPTRAHYNYYVYEFIRSKGGWDNWECELLAECKDWNTIQLASLEQVYKDVMKPALNTNAALGPGGESVECDNCDKIIKHVGLKNHKKTKYCQNFNK